MARQFRIFAALKSFSMKRFLVTSLVVITFAACNSGDDNQYVDKSIIPASSGIPAPANLTYTIIAQHPHDTSAYTQGLELHNGKMYEATGDFENSSIRVTDYTTGQVLQKHMMGNNKIFGEGITILNNKIYQLTWQSNLVYVYDLDNINKPVKTFNWPYEGWGITNNGKDLYISDGTSNIYIVNPEDFKIRSTIGVVTNKGPLDNINELELIGGFIYANIYTTDNIVKIDPESGHVVGIMDFKYLLPLTERTSRTDYFNGIAYDTASKTMFVTGKRWPKLYELKLN